MKNVFQCLIQSNVIVYYFNMQRFIINQTQYKCHISV